MRSAMMFIFCGLSLVFLTFVPPTAAANADIPIDTSAPLSVLHGEYHIEGASQMNYRPTWASVWPLNDMDKGNEGFIISFWPPKYCHAIYVCPVKATSYNANTMFKTAAETCEGEYIKYYPHIQKILLKTGSGNAEQAMSLMSNSLEFKGDIPESAELLVLEEKPASFSTWEEERNKGKRVKFNFKDKDLLVLTNSRMCQVNKPGSQFYPFFRHAAAGGSVGEYPEWLHDGVNSIRTEALPPITKSANGKQVDLLGYIKELEWSSGKVGMLNKQCTDMGQTSELGRKENPNSLFRRVSVQTYDVQIPSKQFQGTLVREFRLSTPSCHWFRIWVTDLTVEAKDYSDKLDLKNTIDVFANEGFYITPNSDIAHPLTSVVELDRWKFRALGTTNDPLIEMSFGFKTDNFVHYGYFEMPKMLENNFRMHIIKAPGCRLSLEKQGSSNWNDYSTGQLTHMWEVNTCSYSFFKDTSK